MYNPKKVLSYNKVNAIRNIFTYAPDNLDIIIDVIKTPKLPQKSLTPDALHLLACTTVHLAP